MQGMPGRINLKEMVLSSRDLVSVPRDQRYDISGRVCYQKRSKQNKRVHFSALCISGLADAGHKGSRHSLETGLTPTWTFFFFYLTSPYIPLLSVHKQECFHICQFVPAHPQAGWPPIFFCACGCVLSSFSACLGLSPWGGHARVEDTV